jgi:tetratricopeptide (TPR) repeat protein
MVSNLICPSCNKAGEFSFFKKREKYVCSECEEELDELPKAPIDPQTIFLSYPHKSEKPDDYDISEELVLLVKAALEKDGHTVWIDKEGIRGGHNWRENITRAILGHDHFLAFLSKRSVRDPGVCLNEIAIALDKGVHFQTLLTESEEVVKPPITVTDTQWHQFVGWQEARSQDQATWDAWFSERMNGIRAQIEDVKNARAPGELTILRRALDPKTFHADIAKKTEDFFGRKWLFEAFDQWLDNTKDQIFWLNGSPGIGKSAFAAKLVHQSNSRVIGFFKCDFQSLKSPEESAKEVICTLAYQLATRMPDYRAKLLYGQGVNDPEVVLKKTADDLFRFLITEPLNKQGKIVEGQRLAIVIDALDEAGRNDGTNPLLTLIKKHAPNLPDWLGIVITSRPEGYIVQELADIKAQSVSGDTAQNTQDLKDYLDKQLDLKITGVQRDQTIKQIIAKSDGAFLYISQIIKDKYDLTEPELLPDGMNGYFMENFSRYFKDAKKYGKETEPFLELMVAAPGPLPKAMAQELLGWTDREVTMQVTEPMGSLLQEKDKGLVFFHKSLADWLQDPKRSGRYQVNPGGTKKLGEFLWREFDKGRPKEEARETEKVKEEKTSKEGPKGTPSVWGQQVVEWLTKLLPNIEQWRDGDPLNSFAKFLHDKLNYQDELIIRKQHVKLSEEEFGGKSAEIANSLHSLGRLSNTLGCYSEAESLYRRALKIFEEVLGPEHPDTVNCLENLGKVLRILGRYDEAEPLLCRALEIREVIFGLEHSDVAASLSNLGMVLRELGRYDEAELFSRKAVKICEEVLGPEHPDTATSLNNLAMILRNLGRYDETEPLLCRALKIREVALGIEHPETATSLNNLGVLLRELGRYDEVEPLYRRALKIYESVLGPKHRQTAFCQSNLGSLLGKLDRYDEGEFLHRRALETFEEMLGPEHPDTVNCLENFIELLDNLGRYEDTRDLHYRVFEFREKSLGPDNPMLVTPLINIGVFLRNSDQLNEAEKYLEKAFAIVESYRDVASKEIARTCSALGKLRALQGRYQQSEDLLLRYLSIGEISSSFDDIKMAKERLYDLYQAWGKPEEVAKYYDTQ